MRKRGKFFGVREEGGGGESKGRGRRCVQCVAFVCCESLGWC